MSDYQHNLQNPSVHRGDGMSARGLLIVLGLIVVGFIALASFTSPIATDGGAETAPAADPAAVVPATEPTAPAAAD